MSPDAALRPSLLRPLNCLGDHRIARSSRSDANTYLSGDPFEFSRSLARIHSGREVKRRAARTCSLIVTSRVSSGGWYASPEAFVIRRPAAYRLAGGRCVRIIISAACESCNAASPDWFGHTFAHGGRSVVLHRIEYDWYQTVPASAHLDSSTSPFSSTAPGHRRGFNFLKCGGLRIRMLTAVVAGGRVRLASRRFLPS